MKKKHQQKKKKHSKSPTKPTLKIPFDVAFEDASDPYFVWITIKIFKGIYLTKILHVKFTRHGASKLNIKGILHYIHHFENTKIMTFFRTQREILFSEKIFFEFIIFLMGQCFRII